MAYWLLKTEPEEYSYSNLEKDGEGVWDGVSNALALKHLRTMEIGDLALIYHTGKERQVVGIAEVVSQPYPDPKLDDPKRVVVRLKAVQKVKQLVTLSQIKQDSHFENFDLLRLPRLSVVPVSEFYWQRLLQLVEIDRLIHPFS
ncbi:EVE domain-containing protein [Scytonema sp. UIC 10036]|uniref:EVE domain-containing protein n=1 Tax=Scytonema sp. UIC 10036 TaxID=2304196 RepID=UPI0012DA6A2A|nr:EVE domain-containing protein [Scytonema sp. UIC 10036]MUH00558.1 EVE domain-containing protein [Scytonema sp. UIC 10036]